MIRLLSLYALLVFSSYAEGVRNWTLDDGTVFSATFKGIKKDSVTLTNESGKDARFSTEELGVADRYFLHTEHDVPLEDLEGGNIYNIEEKVRLSTRDLEKIKSIKLEGEGYKLSLEGYMGPNFLFLYERGVKIEKYVTAVQRALFSHSYRHLDHQERLHKGKRLVYLFIESDDLYDQIGKAYVAEKRAEGKLTEREINQLEQDWGTFRGHRKWEFPAEYMEEFNATSQVDIEILTEERKKSDLYTSGFYNRRWRQVWAHGQRIHERNPGGDNLVIKGNTENSIAFSLKLALVLNNDIRTFGESTHLFGGGIEQPDVILGGRYGESSSWTKELADGIKEGEIEADFNIFYNAPKNVPPTTKSEYHLFTKLLIGSGRFMEKDLKHMFGVCRLCEYMYEKNKCPTAEELPNILGYETMEDLNASFKEFLLNDNKRMKP